MNKYLILISLLIMPYTSFARVPIANLITPVSYFVNHVKQLTTVKNNLVKYKQASIVGISGMGKTQLTRMYAYENKDHYQLIWFIDCNLDINEEFVKLIQAINQQTNSNVVSEDTLQAKKEIMSYLTTKDKWLLVFDNLKVKDNHKVQEFINWEHNGHIIFGSQDGELLPNIVKMTAFERKDAVTLAANILENHDIKLAEFLAEEFVGYPILIVQGAQLLKQVPGLDKEEYKRKIQQSTDKIQLNISLAIKELKPSARELLNKIALINNQGFSKDLLQIITDHKSYLDDDIYQLSKFALISNINPDETNPIFEMHDIVANKIREVNSKENKAFLSNIVDKLVKSIPDGVFKGRIFRDGKTVRESLNIIFQNAEKYEIGIYKIMELGFHSLSSYLNIYDYYNAQKMIDWFDLNDDKNNNFKLWLMNNHDKSIYAQYLGAIGAYYRTCNSGWSLAIKYYSKAKEVLDNVTGSEVIKNNIFYNLAVSNISLGKPQEAEKYINLMDNMFQDGIIDQSDIGLVYFAKARLSILNGHYIVALKQANDCIAIQIEQGFDVNDLLYTFPYLLKAEILSVLGRYRESYDLVQQLYNMHKSVKHEGHEIFGRIFTQMAEVELGLGNLEKSLEHINKAKEIYTKIANQYHKELAALLVTEGNLAFQKRHYNEAINLYQAGEQKYILHFGNDVKVDNISLLFFKIAEVALIVNDEFIYKQYLHKHERLFGLDHPRTKELHRLDLARYKNNN